jgi:hypothetical protein
LTDAAVNRAAMTPSGRISSPAVSEDGNIFLPALYVSDLVVSDDAHGYHGYWLAAQRCGAAADFGRQQDEPARVDQVQYAGALPAHRTGWRATIDDSGCHHRQSE